MYYFEKYEGKIRVYRKIKNNFTETSIKDIFEGLADGKYTFDIKKQRKIRSINQNSFYWGVFLPTLAEYTGEEDIDGLHATLRDKFIGKAKKKRIKNPNNKRQYIVLKHEKTTTTLDTKEFEEYLENIRNLFAPWGWILPYPNDQWTEMLVADYDLNNL